MFICQNYYLVSGTVDENNIWFCEIGCDISHKVAFKVRHQCDFSPKLLTKMKCSKVTRKSIITISFNILYVVSFEA